MLWNWRSSPTVVSLATAPVPPCSPWSPASIDPLNLDATGLKVRRPWRTAALRRTPALGARTRCASASGDQGGPPCATATGCGETVERGRVRSPTVAMARWCVAMFWLGWTGIDGSIIT